MAKRMFHHSGLWVADIDAGRLSFYVEAFDGRLLHKPVLQQGRAAEW